MLEFLERFGAYARPFLPLLAAIATTAVVLLIADRVIMQRRRAANADRRFERQLAMLLLTAAGVLLIVLALPIADATRGQLLGLFGLVLTAVIAFASTSFFANVMAGLMLRAVRNFRPGDFIRVADEFGRVTERGLFHTEIQTEDRDLTTLPNLYLVTHPVTVVRASGTVVSTTLSLGYDVAHHDVEPVLLQAASEAGLEEPFVHVIELGNFAVSYRVAGFLAEARHILSVRSRLRASVLDQLHAAGIEIVSPTFMNQRQLEARSKVLPPARRPLREPLSDAGERAPEELIFDKADRAQELEALRAEHTRLEGEIKQLESRQAKADEAERASLQPEIDARRARCGRITETLELAVADAAGDA